MAIKKVSIANSEYFPWGEKCDGWFLAKHPSASIIQERMLPHTSEKRHYHEKVWQFIYILSGELTMEIEGEEVTLQPFEGIEIIPPLKHNFFNRTDTDITYILVSVPHMADRINLEG